jgi:hypothetical protein
VLPDEQSDAERELAPDPPATEPSAELRKEFWILVVVFNVALLGTALGLLLATLNGQPMLGVSLVFLGAGAFYFGLQRYRHVKEADALFETDTE